jgi:hypothetical protein
VAPLGITFVTKSYEKKGKAMANSKKDYPQTWLPGSPRQQSAARRQIAANKRAMATKAVAKKASPKSRKSK